MDPQTTPGPQAAQRFLLCRPRGGFNDCLVQMENCWQHAQQFNRTLFIDCTREKSLHDLTAFFSLINPIPHVHLTTPKDQIDLFNTLSCHPPQVMGILDTYRTIPIDLSGRGVSKQCCLVDTKTPLQPDLTLDHAAPLLVHESWGGGRKGYQFLKRLQLDPVMASDFLAQIATLGPDYAAVHIRHTDMKTDWRAFLNSLTRRLRGRTVLICSDNAEVVAAARTILAGSTVRTVSDILPADGRPLHRRPDLDPETVHDAMKSALRDLFALGSAADLYVTRAAHGKMSGFSRLASDLCLDKTVLASLLRTSPQTWAAPVGRVHVIESLANRVKRHGARISAQFKRNLSRLTMKLQLRT